MFFLQRTEASAVEQLPQVVRDLHQEVDVAARPRLVAEVVLQAVPAVLLDVEARFYPPAPTPPHPDCVGFPDVPDFETRGELAFVGRSVAVVLHHPHDVEHMPFVASPRDLDARRPRHGAAFDALPVRIVPDERPRIRRVLLHQVLRIGVRPRRAPPLEGEYVLPAVLLAEVHQRGAGVKPVAEDAYPEARERRLQHWREPEEPTVLAVLLLVLVPVVPGLDRD